MKPYYQDSYVTIYHGDCREILPELPKVDLVLTDPPYGVGKAGWDELTPYELNALNMVWLSLCSKLSPAVLTFNTASGNVKEFCELLFPRVRTLIWYKPPGSSYAGSSDDGMFYAFENMYLCSGEKQDICSPKALDVSRLLKEAREKIGLSRGGVDMVIRGKKTGLCYRWEEAACLPTTQQVLALKELLPLNEEFDLALKDANDAKGLTLQALSETRAQRTDVFVYENKTNVCHPCEKPEKLIDTLLLTFTGTPCLILDPFLGSGTTAVSAKKLNRKCIGIEIEEKYCEIAAKRCSQSVMRLDI